MRKNIVLAVLMILAVGYVNADDKVVNTTIVGKVSESATATDLQSAHVDFDQEPTYSFVDGELIMTLGSGTNQVAKVPMRNGAKVVANYDAAKNTDNTISATVSAVGYSTLYSPFQLVVPDGVQVIAPTYDSANEKIVLWGNVKAAGTVIPPCTGLILKNEGKYEFPISFEASDNVSSVLKGSVISEPVSTFEDVTMYSLSNLAEDGTTELPKVGFYQYTADYTVAGKAFLLLDASGAAAAKSIMFDINEELTGIADIEKKFDKVNAYNLAGQRVKADAKGIVIINGKKYINR